MSLASTNNNSNSDRFLKAFYPPGFQKKKEKYKGYLPLSFSYDYSTFFTSGHLPDRILSLLFLAELIRLALYFQKHLSGCGLPG